MKVTTHHVRRSLSVLSPGDTFVFNGLAGSSADSDCLITVTGISVSGNLQYTIRYLDPEDNPEPTAHSTPYPIALRLIEEHIWQPCEATNT